MIRLPLECPLHGGHGLSDRSIHGEVRLLAQAEALLVILLVFLIRLGECSFRRVGMGLGVVLRGREVV
jgi:hypothetical protein